MNGTLKVKATGEAFIFQVESKSSRPFPHRVDLRALAWNGECSCPDFSKRCLPNLKRQVETKGTWDLIPYAGPGQVNPHRTQCKHIWISRKFVMLKIVPATFPPDQSKEEVTANEFTYQLGKYYENQRH